MMYPIHPLTSVVDNLLLLSRVDAGRLELSKDEFGLSEVLEGVLDDALALVEPFDVKVEADVPKHLLLKADRIFDRPESVENAVKHDNPGSRIRVEARAVKGVVE